MTLSNPSAFQMMLHALGIQKRGGTWSKGGWRNYYTTPLRTESDLVWVDLAAMGFSQEGRTINGHNDRVWRVSDKGIDYLRRIGFDVEVSP